MPYQFPYTNLHDLDLDWMLNQVKDAKDKVDSFTSDENYNNIVNDAVERVENSDQYQHTMTDVVAAGTAATQAANAATEAAGRANSAAQTAEDVSDIVAEPFLTTKDYSEGWYVTYSGSLYKFITFHSAGEWNADDVEAVTVGTAVSNIEDNLTNYNSYNVLPLIRKTTGVSNGITYTADSNTYLINGTATSLSIKLLTPTYIPVPDKKQVVVKAFVDDWQAGLRVRIVFFDENNTPITPYVYLSDSNPVMVDIPENATSYNSALSETANSTITNARFRNVIMLSSPDNEYLFYNGIYYRTVISDSADLNNIEAPGTYIVNSAYTYENLPFPATWGATLIVFPPSNNIATQILIPAPAERPLYYRTKVGGTWRAWTELSNSRYYTNTFNDQYFTNTYNITATPSITTDTNNYLAPTGDNTDRTADIQAMLNTGVCRLGPGKYCIENGIEIKDYCSLIGAGSRTVIEFNMDTAQTNYAVKLNSYASLENIRFSTKSATFTKNEVPGNKHCILFQATGDAETSPTMESKSIISNCWITRFNGGAITCDNTGISPTNNLAVTNVHIWNCDVGIYVKYRSEFHRFTNITVNSCYHGAIVNGGNCNFANCDFSSNTVGLFIDNSANQSPNNSHGTFSACTFAHSDNNTGTAIKIYGAQHGEIFTGAEIFYGKIDIDNSLGVRFVGANIGRSVPTEINDSTVVCFDNCTFYDTSNNPITKANSTRVACNNCYYHNGDVVPNP